jgi:ABC-type glycerol-3-phosphate transport system permease component
MCALKNKDTTGHLHSRTRELAKHVFLLALVVAALFPFYMMDTISLKDNAQFATNPWWPEPPFHWENYVVGWEHVGANIFNTTFVAFTSTIGTIAVALLGAFFFARFKLPGSTIMFYGFLVLMLYPSVANMVPTFKLISALGLYNTHWSLILLGIAGAQAFTIFVLRAFIEDLPQDLFDAAEIDGCSLLGQIRHVVIPLCSPIIGVLAVLRIIAVWNDFVGPLILIRDLDKQLLVVSLLHLEGETIKNWGELMAGYTVASLPLVIMFLLSMRLFVRGLSEGAIKG